jgi:signal transduction histidine kinase
MPGTRQRRPPLHTLHGYLDLILRGGAGHVVHRLMLMVRRAGESDERLARRVLDMLLLAHADADYFMLQVGPMDLRQVIQHAVNEVDLATTARVITLHIDIPPEPPPLTADAERREQVARNLQSNAVKFTPRGGHVSVAARAQTHILELSVVDSGIGIAGESLTRIFERS